MYIGKMIKFMKKNHEIRTKKITKFSLLKIMKFEQKKITKFSQVKILNFLKNYIQFKLLLIFEFNLIRNKFEIAFFLIEIS